MEANPYQAPRAQYSAAPDHDDEDFEGDQVLATRGARFGANLIDNIILLVMVVIVGIGVYVVLDLLGIPALAVDQLHDLVFVAFGFVAWIALQIPFLAAGQTLGKRLVGIRIVDYETGRRVSIPRLVFGRYLPTFIFANIPGAGLLDAVFIFGEEQRCLHDRIARTKVVLA